MEKIFAGFPCELGKRSAGHQGLDLGWGKSLQEAKYLSNPDLNLDLLTTQH